MELERALVAFNKDPDRLGRIRIRIPGKNGATEESDNFIDSNKLPWAQPCVPFYSGPDCGSYNVPPVGTWVWVAQESGKLSEGLSYVYFGGIMSGSKKSPSPFNDLDEKRITYVDRRIKMEKDDYVDMGVVPGSTDPDIIKEVQGLSGDDYYPHQRVIFKTPKGATLMVDETDGKESISLIDRSGQIIQMDNPITKDENKGNKRKRGTATALKNNQIRDGKDATITIKSGKVTDVKAGGLPQWWSMVISRLRSVITMRNDDSQRYTTETIEEAHYGVKSASPGSYATEDITDTNIHLTVKDKPFIDIVEGQIHLHVGSSDIIMTEDHILIQSPRIDENP